MATAKNLIVSPTWTSAQSPVTGWQRRGGGPLPVAARSDAPFGARLAGTQNDITVPEFYVRLDGQKWVPGKRYYVNLAYWIGTSGSAGNVTVYLRPDRTHRGPVGDEPGLDSDAEKLVFYDQKTYTTINYYQVSGYLSVPTDLPSDYWTTEGNEPLTVDENTDLWLGITNENNGSWMTIGYISVVEAEHAEAGLDWYWDGAGNTSDIYSVTGFPRTAPKPELGATYAWDGTPYESTSTATYIGEEPEPDPVETTLSLDIAPSEVMVGEPITLTANVTPVEATGSVNFTMDGITSSVPVEDGQAVTEVTAFEDGDYEVVAEYVPSGSPFLPSSATGSVTVTERPPVVLTVGEPAEVNLWVEGGIDPSIPPATWPEHEGLPPGMEIAEDRRIITGTPTQAGEFVVVVMAMDAHFNGYEVGEVTITVEPAEVEPDPAVETTTSLSVVPDEITEGESVSLTATVTPTGAAGSVDFTVDGITSSAQVVNGVATSEVPIFEWGSYEVLAEFVPTDELDFLPSSDTSSVTVTEYIPPLEPVDTTTTLTVVPSTIYEGGSAVLTATVSPAQAQGTITFTLDGATDTIPVTGGTAAREVTVMNAGDYEVNATFAPVSEDYNPSSATPQILSVQPYVEPGDPDGPWDTWNALASNLAPKVAAYAGRADHAETIETAQAQLPVIVEYIKGHTRGRGFENPVPASPLLAVIVSACARLVTNPEQVQYYAVGDYSERPAMLAGWTLTELDVLRRYRRTQA